MLIIERFTEGLHNPELHKITLFTIVSLKDVKGNVAKIFMEVLDNSVIFYVMKW